MSAFKVHVLRAAVAAAGFSITLAAAASIDPSGQWVGSSRLDGSRSVGKTTLVLGAADAEDSTLRIDDRSSCVLRKGRYSSASNGTWLLNFKEAGGGDACTRLARGTFTLQQGSAPRTLLFDVNYPGPDGEPNLRRGALSRYP